ncbi:MAG: ketopantoate reductase family protein, partial [Halobacteriota archaeon]|nr:ketopantoate reductase family protein [Halobacteriota archaeon]
MKVLIFGAGAIGSVIGGFLAEAGQNVSFLGRPWHMEKIRRDGLLISGIWGEHLIKDIEVFNSASEIDGEFDLIILTVKSYNTTEAAKGISSIFKNDPMVVHLQNGLGNREILLEYIPEERLITGRVIFGVEIKPGEVKVTVSADDTVLGATSSAGVKESEIEKIVEIFTSSKIPARSTSNIDKYIWSKVLYNSSLNPLATILECPYGLLAEISHTREIMDQVIEEIYEVGERIGVEFE